MAGVEELGERGAREPRARSRGAAGARRSRYTVRRHYAKWRAEHRLPLRCDSESCAFHSQSLIWNGKRLPLILDQRNGNRRDNSPENLRLLCPKCDSQLPTRGGANRGRVETATENSYILLSKDGHRDHVIIPGTGDLSATGHAPTAQEDTPKGD